MVMVDVANSKLDLLLVVKFIIKSSSLRVCCLESLERLSHSFGECLFSYVRTMDNYEQWIIIICVVKCVCWCLGVDADVDMVTCSETLFKSEKHYLVVLSPYDSVAEAG